MNEQISLDDKDLIIKRYKVRLTGQGGSTVETSIPREVFEREARRLGLTIREAEQKLLAVWRYDSFRGLLLSFEPIEPEREKP
jgi:hypothetical protein